MNKASASLLASQALVTASTYPGSLCASLSKASVRTCAEQKGLPSAKLKAACKHTLVMSLISSLSRWQKCGSFLTVALNAFMEKDT